MIYLIYTAMVYIEMKKEGDNPNFFDLMKAIKMMHAFVYEGKYRPIDYLNAKLRGEYVSGGKVK